MARVDEGDAGAAKITITDDGAGFEPEAAAKLLERGQSSKKARSSDLGLHWCANTIKAMGGRLNASTVWRLACPKD